MATRDACAQVQPGHPSAVQQGRGFRGDRNLMPGPSAKFGVAEMQLLMQSRRSGETEARSNACLVYHYYRYLV